MKLRLDRNGPTAVSTADRLHSGGQLPAIHDVMSSTNTFFSGKQQSPHWKQKKAATRNLAAHAGTRNQDPGLDIRLSCK